MIEAMYGVEFVSNEMGGYGVAVLETNRILGGDSSFVYVGSYEVTNGIVTAQVKCTNDRNLLPSVVGDLKEFNLSLQGTLNENEFILRGHMLEDPSKSIDIKLTRRAELP
jgi:hypothetical protein